MDVAAYSATADTLVGRIIDLIPANPQILEFDSPWELFNVDDFKCDDLQPSLAQASWSLAKAKEVYRNKLKPYLCPGRTIRDESSHSGYSRTKCRTILTRGKPVPYTTDSYFYTCPKCGVVMTIRHNQKPPWVR